MPRPRGSPDSAPRWRCRRRPWARSRASRWCAIPTATGSRSRSAPRSSARWSHLEWATRRCTRQTSTKWGTSCCSARRSTSSPPRSVSSAPSIPRSGTRPAEMAALFVDAWQRVAPAFETILSEALRAPLQAIAAELDGDEVDWVRVRSQAEEAAAAMPLPGGARGPRPWAEQMILRPRPPLAPQAARRSAARRRRRGLASPSEGGS